MSKATSTDMILMKMARNAAKDVKGKKVVQGSSSAHMVQKNRPKSHKKSLSRSPPLLSKRVKR